MSIGFVETGSAIQHVEQTAPGSLPGGVLLFALAHRRGHDLLLVLPAGLTAQVQGVPFAGAARLASGQSALSAVSASVALTLWAFLGMESGTVPAEEVVDPVRTIPRATLMGTGIVTVVYVLGTVVVMGVIDRGTLATSTAPFADAAMALVGPWGYYGMAAGAVISTLGALNGWILISGQVPRAAARDGLDALGGKHAGP